jgi:FAD:protein FMN transferase
MNSAESQIGRHVVLQPRRYHPAKTLLVAGTVLLAIALWTARHRAQDRPRDALSFQGETMATVYHVTVVDPPTDLSEASIRRLIETPLRRVNDALSPYLPHSEITRFNEWPADQPFEVSPLMKRMVSASLFYHELTGGAFDPTVGPLVALWGFGAPGRHRKPPTRTEISRALESTGAGFLAWREDGALIKRTAGLQLDFSAIAKGYAVDGIVDLLRERGVTDLMVEVGGEVRTVGRNARGTPWRIGIEAPLPDAEPGSRLHGILHLEDGAVATSGDYRNYYVDEEGAVVAHILDPRTGLPVRRSRTGVTVYAPACMQADALATALYVMGPGDGLPLIETIEGVEALFIENRPTGAVEITSSGFRDATGYERRP